MDFKYWIGRVIDSGNLCEEYTEKVKSAVSKKDLMDIVLDGNGLKFLMKMQEKGIGLPYSTMLSEFSEYINGKYIYDSSTKNHGNYTSCLYCSYNKDINMHTTAMSLFGCDTDIYIDEYDVVAICADYMCNLRIHCPKTSKVYLDYWEGAHIKVDNKENVILKVGVYD